MQLDHDISSEALKVYGIEDLDTILPTLPPAPGNYWTPIGLYYAIILPTSEMRRGQYPVIHWELELPAAGHTIVFEDKLYKLDTLAYTKRKFITMGIKINSLKDIEKGIEDLIFSVIDIDIIMTENRGRIITFLGFTDPEEFGNTPPDSQYYPKSYRHKKSRINPA